MRSPAATVVTAELFLSVGAGRAAHHICQSPSIMCDAVLSASLLVSATPPIFVSDRRLWSSPRSLSPQASGHRAFVVLLPIVSRLAGSPRSLYIGSLLEPMGVSLLPRSPFRSPSNERTRLGLGSEQTNFLRLSRIDAYARLLRCRGVNGRRHGGHSTLAVHPSK